MLKTLLSKEDTKINLREALDHYEQYLKEFEVDEIVDKLYSNNDLGYWSLSDYLDFAAEVSNEWGNYRYVLDQYIDSENCPDSITVNITDLDDKYGNIEDAIVEWLANEDYDGYVSSFDYVVEGEGNIRIFNIEWE